MIYPLNNELKDFNKLVSINNSQFIYCKFPTNGIPINYEDFLRNLITNGYVPIITNITHCSLNENIKKINELFEYGCLFDIDIFDFHNFNFYAGNDLLFRALRQSTIGAERLDFRVRNGIGYNTFALITRRVIFTI